MEFMSVQVATLVFLSNTGDEPVTAAWQSNIVWSLQVGRRSFPPG